MTEPLDAAALDTLFRDARTRNAFADTPVPESLLREAYDLARLGPTATNCSPARFVFLSSAEAKARIVPLMSGANGRKAVGGGAIVIVAYDLAFAEKIPELFPPNPGAGAYFASPEAAQETAFRNGSLQGAYLMLAARSLGLDCGPMSGFDRAGVDAEFFVGTTWRSNFLCNIGYATDDPGPRHPRLPFEDACRVL